jgi:hypothetical protein
MTSATISINDNPFNILHGRQPEDIYVAEYRVPDSDIVLMPQQVWETYAAFLAYSCTVTGGKAVDPYVDFFAPKVIGSRIHRHEIEQLASDMQGRIHPRLVEAPISQMRALTNKIIPQRMLHYLALKDDVFAEVLAAEPITLLALVEDYYVIKGNHKNTAAAQRGQSALRCQVFNLAQITAVEQQEIAQRVKLESSDFNKAAKRYGGEGRHVDFVKVFRNQFLWDIPHYIKK